MSAGSLKDLLANLQRDYVASIPKKRETLEKLWQSGNIPDLQIEFHKLKGTGRTYGLPEISLLGEAMEAVCLKDRSHLAQTVPLSLLLLERVLQARTAQAPFSIETDPDYLTIAGIVASLNSKAA